MNAKLIADLESQLAYAMAQKGAWWKLEAVKVKAKLDSAR